MKKFKFTINGNDYEVEVNSFEDNIAEIDVNGTTYQVQVHREVQKQKTPKLVRSAIPVQGIIPKMEGGGGTIKSPLPGNIIEIHVHAGDAVKKGDKLMIMEAMKMENNVLAEKDGVVKTIKVKVGDSVLQGDVLIEMA